MKQREPVRSAANYRQNKKCRSSPLRGFISKHKNSVASVFCFQRKVHTERGELLLIIARPESDLFVLWRGSHGRSITITTHTRTKSREPLTGGNSLCLCTEIAHLQSARGTKQLWQSVTKLLFKGGIRYHQQEATLTAGTIISSCKSLECTNIFLSNQLRRKQFSEFIRLKKYWLRFD